MQPLDVSGAVRPLKGSLGVKVLRGFSDLPTLIVKAKFEIIKLWALEQGVLVVMN